MAPITVKHRRGGRCTNNTETEGKRASKGVPASHPGDYGNLESRRDKTMGRRRVQQWTGSEVVQHPFGDRCAAAAAAAPGDHLIPAYSSRPSSAP
ncbi:hypothetical protein E2C01_029336 [Portunus trituberculatus]|uniref:Uncharacterized protein n=1 Tax=Portunus trituberculatus TaxID=210409 RepID=A0A5B7ERY5_PORTR|nr:hypothetical protein [Portunus trituberculatus]